MDTSTIRQRVGTSIAVALLTSAAGCGSANVGSTRSPAGKKVATIEAHSVKLVDLDTSSRVQAAVGDRTHGMILTNDSSGSPNQSAISGATVFDTDTGATSKVSLPELDGAKLVPWSGGYAVGGVHCIKRSTQGFESACDTWLPTVAFLHPNGVLDKIVYGAEQNSTSSFATVYPGKDVVIFRVADGAWKSVDKSGFSEIPGTKAMAGVCRTADGDYIGVTAPPVMEGGTSAEEKGSFKLAISHNGVWSDLPGNATYDNSKGTSVLFSCVVGGLVTTLGTVTDASGLKGDARSPDHYGTVDDFVADAVGIDSSGSVLLSFPTAKGLSPQAVGGSPILQSKVDNADRWAGISADGLCVLLGSASGARIVTVDS